MVGLTAWGSPPPAQIRVDTALSPDGTALVTIAGELDVATEVVLRAVLEEILVTEPVRVAFDLAGLEFIDSSGLLLVVATAASVRAFELRNPSCVVRRVVELSGLASMLNMTP